LKTKKVIYGKLSKKDNDVIYVCDKDFRRPFTDNKSIFIGINELNKISSLITKNPQFFDGFLYKKTSFWWLQYNPISKYFIEIIDFLDNFLNFIEKNKPTKIIIKDDFTNFDLINEICSVYNIELNYSKSSLLKFNLLKKSKEKIKKQVVTLIFKKKIKDRQKQLLKKPNLKQNFKNKIIFVSYSTYRRQIFDFDKLIAKNDEFIIYQLTKFLNSDQIVGIDLFSQIKSDNKILEQRLNSNLNWVPIEFFLENGQYSSESKRFFTIYDELINSKSFQEIFTFRKINYWKKIFPKFNQMKNDYYFPFWVRWIDAIRFHFKRETPKAIFILYETAPLSLAIISVCKELGIKTFGLQHGIIHDHHPYYMHENFSNDDFSNFILPEKLLLFGDIPRDILLRRGYPSKKLVSFGNPIFFNYKSIDESTINKFREKFGLNNFKHVILFAPPNLQENKNEINFNMEILSRLISDFNDQTDYVILIKLHPLDSPSKYEKLLKNIMNFKIIDGNILELILLSDVVISTYSTTILDAMALQKPVIQIKFDNENFPMPFDNYNCVLSSNLSEMMLKIDKLMTDKKLRKTIIQNGNQFIKKYYNIPLDNLQEKINSILNN